MIVRRNNARRTQSEDTPGVTPSSLSPETGGTTVSTWFYTVGLDYLSETFFAYLFQLDLSRARAYL